MSEEQTEKKKEAAPKKGSKLFSFVILPLAMILIAATAALLAWQFVIKPRMEVKPAGQPPNADMIPPMAVTVPFEDAHTTVVMSDPEFPASTLLYKVALVCNNQATADIVQNRNNLPRFVNMLRKVHSYKSRDELSDPMIEANLQRQIVQQANQILERLQEAPDPEVKVIEALHLAFFVQDL